GGGPDQPVGRTLVIDKAALERSTNPLACSNFCRQVRLHPSVDSSFVNLNLIHQYKKGRFNVFQTETTNIRNLNFSQFLAETEIPLPPTVEQKRISSQLAVLMAQVSRASDHLSRVPAILKRFRQAVLAAACSGSLTADWRLHHTPRTPSDASLAGILAKRSDRAKHYGIRVAREPAKADLSQLSDIPEDWAVTNIDQLS